ncbi:MAG: TRAP transporter substrate-binding protein [Planctomycetota bacterium]
MTEKNRSDDRAPEPIAEDRPIERRRFLGHAATTAAAAAVVGCSGGGDSAPGAVTQPRVKWRLTSSFPRSLDVLFGASEVFAKRVEALTDGRFTIRVHAPTEVVGGLEVLDAVRRSVVEMGHSASYYFTGQSDALVFDAAVPFGLNARQQLAWSASAGGHELMREVFSDFNILNFRGGNTGVQMGGWFRRQVDSLADLQGLKMRIPGLGGQVMSRLGATVQVIPGGDIYPALERGAIDATEWVGPADDEKLGFHRIAKNYYYPGWWEPGAGLSFYVNKDAYAKLPSTYQAAIEVATEEAGRWVMTEYDAKNPPALKRLLAQGVTLRPFSDDVMAKAAKETTELLEETASKDPQYRKIYDHWRAFRESSSKWFGSAELTYARFVSGRG